MGRVLIAASTLALLTGCSQDPQASKPATSDVDLAVGIPGGPAGSGTVADPNSIDPPDLLPGSDSPTNVTLGDAPTDPQLATGDESSANSSETIPAGENRGGPEDWRQWDSPEVVLVVTGQQHGYIEPCGCTGLENQKGGMMRRYSLLQQIRDRGWDVVPVDAGNQVRRSGRQAAIKFQTSVKGLEEMGYRTIGIGPDDLNLGASELLRIAADDGTGTNPFATANVEMLAPDLVAGFRKIEAGGRVIGITTALDPASIQSPIDDAFQIGALEESLRKVLEKMRDADCQFKVLLLFGTNDAATRIARDVPGFDLIVAGDTVGEPRYQAEKVDGTETRLIMTGDKGMYVGLVGLFADQPFKYSRVALTSDFQDARPMLDLMAGYQNQLKQLGLDGLEVNAVSHPTGKEFVGTAKCGECHTTAFDIWSGTPHAEATEHLVHPGERSEIPRHFDPECLSCHVTGWNPQGYYPYQSGYLSLEQTPQMVGNGCENCHGPGKAHTEAEEGGSGLTDQQIEELREGMRLTLDRARDKCLECHDLDNSPDFHKDGAFEDYWSQVEHYGMD
jgi:hypothetical protein